MPYKLQRPGSSSGLGPLAVYRAIARANQSLLQTPQHWISRHDYYHAITASAEPAVTASSLYHASPQNVGSVLKIWREMALEEARKQIAPEMPSRDDCVFACFDLLEAFSFEMHANEPRNVWAGSVVDGAPWWVVDMASFPSAAPADPAGPAEFQAAFDFGVVEAHAYWRPGESLKRAEVLVKGDVLLTHRPDIVDLFRAIGLVE